MPICSTHPWLGGTEHQLLCAFKVWMYIHAAELLPNTRGLTLVWGRCRENKRGGVFWLEHLYAPSLRNISTSTDFSRIYSNTNTNLPMSLNSNSLFIFWRCYNYTFIHTPYRLKTASSSCKSSSNFFQWKILEWNSGNVLPFFIAEIWNFSTSMWLG